MVAETKTGGRAATKGVVEGRIALSVGRPSIPEPIGFSWTPLSEVARLESGHTPSRSRDDYWGGDIPWIGIRDATGGHGRVLDDTQGHITQAGLDNSSARLLPAGTICLSRTASVGYVVEMGRPMATSQDFVNWVPGPDLNGRYLRYVLMLEQESVRRFAHGTTHQTMYYPEAKALQVLLPSRPVQDAIAEVLGALDDKIAANERTVEVARRLMGTLGETIAERACVRDLATHVTESVKVADFDDEVALYSLPAYDAGAGPELVGGASVKSNKTRVDGPAVLMSKLNPRIPRIWDVVQPDGGVMNLASTEFVVLKPRDVSSSALWTALSHPRVSTSVAGLVAGTSGSHQRVRPGEILNVAVPDVRLLSPDVAAELSGLGLSVQARLDESRTLVSTRDALLPLLMSGKLRVKDVERQVEEVL